MQIFADSADEAKRVHQRSGQNQFDDPMIQVSGQDLMWPIGGVETGAITAWRKKERGIDLEKSFFSKNQFGAEGGELVLKAVSICVFETNLVDRVWCVAGGKKKIG